MSRMLSTPSRPEEAQQLLLPLLRNHWTAHGPSPRARAFA